MPSRRQQQTLPAAASPFLTNIKARTPKLATILPTSPFRTPASTSTKSDRSRQAAAPHSNPSHRSPTPPPTPSLAGLIAVNQPDATATGVTNTSGHLTFTGLSDGLYLAVSDSVDVKVANASGKNQTWTCSSGSMLVAVPEDGVSGGSRVLSIEPKTECVAQPPKTVERTVRKIWNDRNNSDGKRPESITVKLLRDGVVFEEVKLNESNKWAHSWTGLSSAHQWAVVEASVPSGYTTLSDVEGDTTTITNTHTPPTTPDQPHTGADVQQAAWIAVAILGAGLVLLIVAKTALRKRA